MSDIKATSATTFDIQTDGSDFVKDSGLENAVILSLFLDARRPSTGPAASAQEDPRGWFGNQFGEHELGSLLWTVRNEPISFELGRRKKEMAEAALAWMVSSGLAESVAASVVFSGQRQTMVVTIKRPQNAGDFVRKYDLNWSEYALGN